jgi:hypothetical protein
MNFMFFLILNFRCNFFLNSFRYWLHLQISDHTTSTTCTLSDDEAKRLLNISTSDLLVKLQGDVESVPQVIQKLYGMLYIYSNSC